MYKRQAKTRFRHYVNLRRTEGRLERLLADFNWGRMDEIFLSNGSDVSAMKAPKVNS